MDTQLYWINRGNDYFNEFKKHNPITRYRFWRQEQELRKVLPKDIESVLEIGCGFGRITKILLENPGIRRIVATDLSPAQIARAKEQINDPRVEFAVLSAFDLNYSKEFDLVIASEVLMHIEDAQTVICLMERAAKLFCMNIDWYAPDEPLAAGGWCWQHPYEEMYSNGRLVKKLYRQGIFLND